MSSFINVTTEALYHELVDLGYSPITDYTSVDLKFNPWYLHIWVTGGVLVVNERCEVPAKKLKLTKRHVFDLQSPNSLLELMRIIRSRDDNHIPVRDMHLPEL